MKSIREENLLESYKKQVEAGKITFVSKARDNDRNTILALVQHLWDLFHKAGKEQVNLDWHECHQKCTELWRLLARLALEDIDSESKGNARLSEFLVETTKFEEVLYGLEDYYRDHTLHSLWVYLLGDYLLRDMLKTTYKDVNWYLFNDVENESSWKHLKRRATDKENELCRQVNEKKDAIWCITALCHDLGYPLSKLGEINKRVGKVLNFFDLHGFDRVGYELKIEHQYLTKQFLELMADDMRIQANIEENDIEVKLFRDDGSYWRFCDSLEKREHGTLSAFILYKLLGIFGDATLRGPAVDWGLEDEEAVDTLIRGTILYAIAQHGLKFNWADELGSLADVLLLADEVEEFARWGRPVKTRIYLPTLAEVSLDINYKPAKDRSNVAITINYKANKAHDIKQFFERKARRLTEIYHLKPPEALGRARAGRPRESRFPKIISIKMTASNEEQEFMLELGKDRIKASLPSKKNKNMFSTYDIKFINDELYVIDRNAEEGLRKWLGLPEE